MRLVLESRFMFDASVGAATHHLRDFGHYVGQDGYTAAVEVALHRYTDAASTGERPVATTRQGHISAHVPSDSAAALAPVAVSAVLFVDPRVANWQTLADSVAPGTNVVVVPSADGLAQVSATMRGLRDGQTVNFLTYGTAGQIELGASTVDASALSANAHEVAGWRDHMADNAQILRFCTRGKPRGRCVL